MRRTAALLAATCLILPAAARAADLTLRRVMLSAAGIGYFEYTGHADGPAATLGLDLPLDQVDDVLNSLAVFDDHGGVGSIELPSRDDSSRAFARVPFPQAALDNPATLLGQLRGEEITIAGPDAMTGRIVSAVAEPLAAKPDPDAERPPASHTRITLLTEDGFRQFILEDADSVRPTDPALRARIAAALDAARTRTAAAIRHLTLRSTGDAARTLSVGYVTAAPLWKATYRLILPASGQDQARIQGWAVLENQSGQDWHGVDLTLHAGNPVTFHQAIYASYIADRPEIPVEVPGHLLPDADLGAAAPGAQPRLLKAERSPFFPTAKGPREPMAAPEAYASEAMPAPPLPAPMALSKPTAAADAAETALDTVFHIAAPVDLAAGHSASVPILDQTLHAEALDWLQPGATRPVSAIRLTNTTATSLPGGALTLYTTDAQNGPAFAGDARLTGLPAGQTRLLGFAEDLRTRVTRAEESQPRTTLHVTAADGTITRTLRTRTTDTVTITAPPHEPRRVLVEFAKTQDASFTLTDGASRDGALKDGALKDGALKDGAMTQEETATAWRVTVPLAPGQTRRLTADIDTTDDAEITLLTGNDIADEALTTIATDGSLDDAAMAKLRPLLALRDTLSARQAARQHLAAAQQDATADEDRVRNNLRVVTGAGMLHDKLLAGLDADETRLATLRDALARAQGEEDAAHAALVDAVGKLKI